MYTIVRSPKIYSNLVFQTIAKKTQTIHGFLFFQILISMQLCTVPQRKQTSLLIYQFYDQLPYIFLNIA